MKSLYALICCAAALICTPAKAQLSFSILNAGTGTDTNKFFSSLSSMSDTDLVFYQNSKFEFVPTFARFSDLYVSSDQGASWQKLDLSSFTHDQPWSSFTVENRLFLRSGPQGFNTPFYYSDDYGQSWNSVDTNSFPNPELYGGMTPYMYNDTLFMTMRDTTSHLVFWKSADKGDTWIEKIDPNIIESTNNLSYFLYRNDTMFISFTEGFPSLQNKHYYSVNYGRNWIASSAFRTLPANTFDEFQQDPWGGIINVRTFTDPSTNLQTKTVWALADTLAGWTLMDFYQSGQMIEDNVVNILFKEDFAIVALSDKAGQGGVHIHKAIKRDITSAGEQTSTIEAKLFPNPCANELFLSYGSEKLLGMQILNTQGQVVKSFELNGLNSRFDLSELPAAVYYVHIKGSETQKTLRLLKY